MIWGLGRAVVWLKRSALAQERMAKSIEDLNILARQEFSLAHPTRRTIKSAEFGVADVQEDWNKRYEIEQQGGGES